MRTHFFGNFCLTDSLFYCSVDSRLIQMVTVYYSTTRVFWETQNRKYILWCF